MRKKRMHDLATLISKRYRGWIKRKKVKKIKCWRGSISYLNKHNFYNLMPISSSNEQLIDLHYDLH